MRQYFIKDAIIKEIFWCWSKQKKVIESLEDLQGLHFREVWGIFLVIIIYNFSPILFLLANLISDCFIFSLDEGRKYELIPG